MPITILLVDDQAAVRQGLRMRLALEADLAVVGEARDGLEAVERAQALKPDVVVMDVSMPRLDGIAAAAEVRKIRPGPAVIILSLHDDAATRRQAGEVRAAFVAKQAGVEALITAIRRAAGREATESTQEALKR